jgi:hypothetical protein
MFSPRARQLIAVLAVLLALALVVPALYSLLSALGS